MEQSSCKTRRGRRCSRCVRGIEVATLGAKKRCAANNQLMNRQSRISFVSVLMQHRQAPLYTLGTTYWNGRSRCARSPGTRASGLHTTRAGSRAPDGFSCVADDVSCVWPKDCHAPLVRAKVLSSVANASERHFPQANPKMVFITFISVYFFYESTLSFRFPFAGPGSLLRLGRAGLEARPPRSGGLR